MFTGIIQEIGILQRREKRGENLVLTIQSKEIIKELKEGSSIAVNGACLTAEEVTQNFFRASVIPETAAKTTLGKIHVSSRLNLEPALCVTSKIDGHFVTGHIDGIGLIAEKGPVAGGIGIKIEFPKVLSKFLSVKGSITVNGISLTVADLDDAAFSVALAPFTQKNTNLGIIAPGEEVNLEIDLIARYLDSLLQGKESEIKYEWLKERNFI